MGEILNTTDMLLYICDIIKDQNKSDESYELIRNNINPKVYSKNIVSIDKMFMELEKKFGTREYRSHFINHFLKNSKSIEGTVDYNYEVRSVEDFLGFVIVLDRLFRIYKRNMISGDKLYFNAFTAINPQNPLEFTEKVIFYNDIFADSDTGDSNDQDFIDHIINREICLSDDLISVGLVKNRFKPFYRILFKMNRDNEETYNLFDIPICFNVGWYFSKDMIRYIKHPYDYILNNMDLDTVLIDIAI